MWYKPDITFPIYIISIIDKLILYNKLYTPIGVSVVVTAAIKSIQ